MKIGNFYPDVCKLMIRTSCILGLPLKDHFDKLIQIENLDSWSELCVGLFDGGWQRWHCWSCEDGS